jgi:hypothetical protein
MGDQGLDDEFRRRVFGLADGEGDVAPVLRGRLDARLEGGELFEGVGLEPGQIGIHAGCRDSRLGSKVN